MHDVICIHPADPVAGNLVDCKIQSVDQTVSRVVVQFEAFVTQRVDDGLRFIATIVIDGDYLVVLERLSKYRLDRGAYGCCYITIRHDN